jgi:Glycosyl transferase family 2
MTLLARDEADIVDAQIAFHLHAGVDFVIATDNGSLDGTTEILEAYARQGVLHLIREPELDMRQEEWVTHMARLAASDFEADWVLNSDADEFWWPRGGTLPEVLATIPPRYGVVRCLWRHFAPRPDTHSLFAERMTVRLTLSHPWNDPANPFNVNQKIVHRADPEVIVAWGNHDVSAAGLLPLGGWHPIEVLHFPLRTPEQYERKVVNAWSAWSRSQTRGPQPHQVAAYDAYREGRLRERYESFVIDDTALERGLEDGTLVVDTRLRDVLRTLGADSRSARIGLPVADRDPLDFPTPDLADEASYAEDASVLAERESTRTLARIESLRRQLMLMEQSWSWRATAPLRGSRSFLRRALPR